MSNTTTSLIDENFLKLLVCPITHSRLEYDAKNSQLVSCQGQITYPVISGIPILTRERSKKIVIDI